MNLKNKSSQAGFSLVELMVVVAIIGILAAMSVGQVQKQIAKSRQAESKTNLASLYGAEKAFQAEWSSYTGDFGALGLGFEGNLRYSVGFAAVGVDPTTDIGGWTGSATGVSAARSGAGNCPGACDVINSNGVAPTDPTGTVTNAATFSATAHAMIYVPNGAATGTEDVWSLNQNKILANDAPGIVD